MTTISKRSAAGEKKSSALRKATNKLEKSGSIVGVKTTERKIDYTFENGMTINGTIEQIEKVAATMKLKVNYKSLGHRPTGFYDSTTKGMVKISEMNDYHLRRALLKEAKEYYSNMYSATDSNTDFLRKFTGMAEVTVIVELFTELSKR